MLKTRHVLALCALSVLTPVSSLAGEVPPEITTVTSGGPCKAGINTNNDTMTVLPGDPLLNPSVASITMVKPCSGAVTATFAANVNATTGSQNVYVVAIATCTGTGGFATPHCTVGQKIAASPGGFTLKDAGASSVTESHPGAFAWKALKRGKWRFDIKAGGSDSPSIENRTLIVEAYKGG